MDNLHVAFEYTEEQKVAIDRGLEALNSKKKLFKIGGAAGTGKSTIMKAITSEFSGLAICAFAGKAASVLRSKGMAATTIHNRIYEWDEYDQIFQKVPKVKYSGFAVDEASMVGGEIFADMQSYGLPVIAIGDHHQLEPVNSKDINLMKECDVTLEKIHRQAEGNPIIDLATRIRRKEKWGYQDDPNASVIKKVEFWNHIPWADVILCGYNKTRVTVNNRVRMARGYKNELEAGERIICLQNDQQLGVFNGLCFDVLKVKELGTTLIADIQTDDGKIRENVKISRISFGQEKAPDWKVTRRMQGKMIIADYAYAMTVHKAQGSEWKKVLILEEQAPKLWNPDRWNYTAVTRASEFVKLCK